MYGLVTLDFVTPSYLKCKFNFICLNVCMVVVGGRVADKRGDYHTGALDLIEHAAMLIENPLFIRANRSGRLRNPLSENTQINDPKLCWSTKWWERQMRGGSQLLGGLLSLAVQFLRERLTCQSVIDLGSWAEGDVLRTVSDLLGTAPPDRGQVGWSKINHSLFPLSPGLGEVTSKGVPHTSRHTGLLSSFSSTLSIFLSLP